MITVCILCEFIEFSTGDIFFVGFGGMFVVITCKACNDTPQNMSPFFPYPHAKDK